MAVPFGFGVFVGFADVEDGGFFRKIVYFPMISQ